MELQQGDLLRVPLGSQLRVACADATLVTVKESSPVPCRTEGALRQVRSPDSSRNGNSQPLPIILSPRATKLLQPRPLLRWAAVPGQSRYELAIKDLVAGKTHWSTVVKDKTELLYPKEAPPLIAGRGYLLQVTAGGSSSDSEGPMDRSFSVLEPEEAAAVQNVERALTALQLPPEKIRFLAASLYFHHALYAEVMGRLEGQPEVSQESAPARLLAEAYLRTGRLREAGGLLRKAVELSGKAQDIEGGIEAERGLGWVLQAFGNPEGAERLRSACSRYLELWAPEKVVELKKLKGCP
jgi:tetratricopeptide (TPR) repeat protein